ncbi:MAG TPA: aminoacyl-tRNA hydrolase [Phaeodactylibacter sp.]|nr:aminoacyl-tRNA hydrolase [Phaeodactylibacter sp.]
MKYLIVGLGNIGSEYDHTRHNIGFEVIDHLAQEKELSFKEGGNALTTTYKYKGRTFILLKPTTYMNLSGKAVRYRMQKEKIKAENLLVVLDDLNIPFGKLLLRPKGSDGGHNGLKDIDKLLNTNKYARLRLGIGNASAKIKGSNYVLGEWTDEEKEQLPALLQKAINTIKAFGTIGLKRAMAELK